MVSGKSNVHDGPKKRSFDAVWNTKMPALAS